MLGFILLLGLRCLLIGEILFLTFFLLLVGSLRWLKIIINELKTRKCLLVDVALKFQLDFQLLLQINELSHHILDTDVEAVDLGNNRRHTSLIKDLIQVGSLEELMRKDVFSTSL